MSKRNKPIKENYDMADAIAVILCGVDKNVFLTNSKE